MKKLLLINASPRGEGGNTFKATREFLEGFTEICPDALLEKVWLYDMNIKPCVGCFSCWGPTPGRCVLSDDMEALRRKVLDADIIIESFPLYFFGMPSQLKAMTDRMMPFMLPYRGEVAQGTDKPLHEQRYDMNDKRLVLISSCGYCNTNIIYDALLREYDIICGEGRYTPILCPQAGLMGTEQLHDVYSPLFANVREAGRQMARDGRVSEKTLEAIRTPVLPQRAFAAMTGGYWDSFENK
ncbi:MAG: flavodoxin family protein [Eubacteriales bacterium]